MSRWVTLVIGSIILIIIVAALAGPLDQSIAQEPTCETPAHPVPCPSPFPLLFATLVPILIVMGIALAIIGYYVQRKYPPEEEKK